MHFCNEPSWIFIRMYFENTFFVTSLPFLLFKFYITTSEQEIYKKNEFMFQSQVHSYLIPKYTISYLI